MPAQNEIHLNDVGTVFRVTIKDCDVNGNSVVVDVSGATLKEIHFRDSQGTLIVQTASFYTDGTDGILEYISQSGDLNFIGPWKLQAKVTIPAGTFSSSFERFEVYPNV